MTAEDIKGLVAELRERANLSVVETYESVDRDLDEQAADALERAASNHAVLIEALEAAREIVHQIVLAATEDHSFDPENDDGAWFAEHGGTALAKIDAALAAAKPIAFVRGLEDLTFTMEPLP